MCFFLAFLKLSNWPLLNLILGFLCWSFAGQIVCWWFFFYSGPGTVVLGIVSSGGDHWSASNICYERVGQFWRLWFFFLGKSSVRRKMTPSRIVHSWGLHGKCWPGQLLQSRTICLHSDLKIQTVFVGKCCPVCVETAGNRRVNSFKRVIYGLFPHVYEKLTPKIYHKNKVQLWCAQHHIDANARVACM